MCLGFAGGVFGGSGDGGRGKRGGCGRRRGDGFFVWGGRNAAVLGVVGTRRRQPFDGFVGENELGRGGRGGGGQQQLDEFVQRELDSSAFIPSSTRPVRRASDLK